MSDDLNQVVPKTVLKIDVKHNREKVNIDFNEVHFTEIEPYYTDRKPKPHKGILSIYSLEGLLERLNTYGGKDKNKAPAILKGLYEGGTSGLYCQVPAPFLFFDVDVKNSENSHLFDSFKNAQAFETLVSIAILVWRSHSGNGIAGILYVPQLSEVTRDETSKHKKIGDTITSYLSKELLKKGIKINFDTAQNKFRQIRFLAEQKEEISFNLQPVTFIYTLEEIVEKLPNGSPVLRYKNFNYSPGSIREQFNRKNPIADTMLQCGFLKVTGTNRYKHPSTSSTSSGPIDTVQNRYFNHSQSFSNRNVFDPFGLVCFTHYNNDFNTFYKALKEEGYSDHNPTTDILVEAEKILRNSKKNQRTKAIFEACHKLKLCSHNAKIKFVQKNCANPNERPLFYRYLKLKDLVIPYDCHLNFDKYVGERLEQVLQLADDYKKIIVRADTGTGKTYAFSNMFSSCKPGMRCLILVPLTVIVEQYGEINTNIVGLTGQSKNNDHRGAYSQPIVIATYEQGAKYLKAGMHFDYVVVDEVHNLISANSYKDDVIRDVTMSLGDIKVIGLTGTPNNIFKTIGYRLINATKKSQQKTLLTQRCDNRDPFKIIIQHLKNVKGKAIIRVNSKQTIKDVKDSLIKDKIYGKEEILLLYSEEHIKQSNGYKHLIEKKCFEEKIRVVLTTGIIDEGLNIDQDGFTDVMFIENTYGPRPEPVKQFMARFRNIDPNRTYHYYYKIVNDQSEKFFNTELDFSKKMETLEDEIKILSDGNPVLSTWNDLANDSHFYYSDSTINPYYLGFQTTDLLFKKLNHEEYNFYLECNYNLQITVDREHNYQAIDTQDKEANRILTKQIIYDLWTTKREEVFVAVRYLTSRKEIKDWIEDSEEPLVDEVADKVLKDLSNYEKIIKNYMEFLRLGIDNPDNYILENNQLKSQQKIKRDIKLLQSIKVIDCPESNRDYRNREKIILFLQEIQKLNEFTVVELIKLWKQQRVTNYISYKDYYLLDLVKHFLGWTRTKDGIYRVGKKDITGFVLLREEKSSYVPKKVLKIGGEPPKQTSLF